MPESCLIVGAGMSGLMAARLLKDAGWRVTVLDKGRGPGGRMATRRFAGGIFDHGAQFFTARSQEFQQQIAQWLEIGLIRQWALGFGTNDGHPRYCGAAGMNTIPKHMAAGLDVHCEVQVSYIQWEHGEWCVTAGETVFKAGHLILTSPVPQSLAFFEPGTLPATALGPLQSIEYERCLALLCRTLPAVQLPEPGAIQTTGSDKFTWCADNFRKGVSPLPGTLTIHAAPALSLSQWDTPAENVLSLLLPDLTDLILGFSAAETQLHRWKFSKPIAQFPQRTLFSESPGPVVFAGDAFGEPRVEGAYLSGRAAAAVLLGKSVVN